MGSERRQEEAQGLTRMRFLIHSGMLDVPLGSALRLQCSFLYFFFLMLRLILFVSFSPYKQQQLSICNVIIPARHVRSDLLGSAEFAISRFADNTNWRNPGGLFLLVASFLPRSHPLVKSTSFCESPTLQEISAYETAAQSDWRQSGPY